jgi:hypothetical protein
MKNILSTIGSVVGWSGVIVCLASGLSKLVGSYYIYNYEVMTIFTVGIAMIAAGCMAKLEAQTR